MSIIHPDILNEVWENREVLFREFEKLIPVRDLESANDLEFLRLIEIANTLPKIKSAVNYVDIDFTLLTRIHTLQNAKISDARWDLWNELIVNELGGFDQFAKEQYSHGDIQCKTIAAILKDQVSYALTAGVDEFQHAKLKYANLSPSKKEDVITVKKASQKPLAMLYHIVNKLKYIPTTITLYDDRVDDLIDDFLLISQLLDIEVNVYKVKLSESNTQSVESMKLFRFQHWKELKIN